MKESCQFAKTDPIEHYTFDNSLGSKVWKSGLVGIEELFGHIHSIEDENTKGFFGVDYSQGYRATVYYTDYVTEDINKRFFPL